MPSSSIGFMEQHFPFFASLDWSVIPSSLPLLMKGMSVTLQITVTSICFGIVWGAVLAVWRISPYAPLRWLSKVYVNCFRSIPLVMVLMWFYLIIPQFLTKMLGLSPKTDIRLISAVVAFTLFEAAYYSEIIRAGINSISKGQNYAALALGMTRGQALRLVILPQAFRVMTPLLMTQGIILFQDSALVYVLGLADFFRTATNIGKTSGNEVEMIMFAGLIYFIICFLVSVLVNYLKKRIV